MKANRTENYNKVCCVNTLAAMMLRTKDYMPSTVFKCTLLSCVQLCVPMDCTVHGILQARILKWIAFPLPRGSSQPRDQTQVSCIAGDSLPAELSGTKCLPCSRARGSSSLASS